MFFFVWFFLMGLVAFDFFVKLSFMEKEAQHLFNLNNVHLIEIRDICSEIKKDQLRSYWLKSENLHYEDLLLMKYLGVYDSKEKGMNTIY